MMKIPVPGLEEGQAALLLDQGRTILVGQDHDSLLIDRAGRVLSEFPVKNISGGEFCATCKRIVFWAVRGQSTLVYVAGIGDESTPSSLKLATVWPEIVAGFKAQFTADANVLRISAGQQSWLVDLNGNAIAQDPWRLSLSRVSPDGTMVAGQSRDGQLTLRSLGGPGKAVQTGVQISGPPKWDPSSRYLVAEHPTRGWPLLLFSNDLVLFDVVARDYTYVQPLLPNDSSHRYEWVRE